MNLTLSLIAGLTLLLPGLSAIAAWNFRGAAEGGATQELPLTSASALFAIIAISGLLHLAGYWITDLTWLSAVGISQSLPSKLRFLPLTPRPYEKRGRSWSIPVMHRAEALRMRSAPMFALSPCSP